MKWSFAAALVVWSGVAAAPAYAGYEEGLLAYQEGLFPSALQEFHALALRGHSGAEFMLGVMYFNATGVKLDQVVAAIYFRQAADQGDPGAQLAFGSLHIHGLGVLQDLVEARKWLSICSRGDSPDLTRQATALLKATATLMTPAEITRADRSAERWRSTRPGLVRQQ